ncbi:HlyD family type I secretion periplasmic adaptor subunit [Thioalkalivibrio versutus]|uniref:HlyD family type I secretion periplasmic adaptor subunit n=1 Tax=Thioalkalivibrio versutus TaxID=106634 RepID=UPI00038245AE|nr:HlyD family type I secretion periplasmic adaptor subunit [Thioalkalivibrio versutus]OOC50268.1 HlyD family type I secretion periplasmic adaptor subunit [Thioalkalivibrio versutus]
MGILRKAWGDLGGRYRRVFARAWARRREMDPPRRQTHEHEFMPAALSLQETPVHPLPRVIVGAILLLAVLALIWATLGRMDIVAVAEGRVVPDGRTQTIQATETASVHAIHVRDGQRVKAGEILIELDPTLPGADLERLGVEYRSTRLTAARSEAFLEALEAEEGIPLLNTGYPVPENARRLEERVLVGHVHHYRARIQQLQAETARRQQEVEATRAMVISLENTLPIIRRRSEDFRQLSDQGLAAAHEQLELEQNYIETTHQLIAQRARLAEAEAALHEVREQREALRAESRREALDILHRARSDAESLRQDLIKARRLDELTRLRAPVDGTVEQLAVHTVGGVVEPARPLMVVVPEDGAVEVEATLPNKDIGFVRAGQEAEVKLQTFPYTKYGTIDGVVTDVSQDAVQDEQQGLVFVVRVRLEQDTVDVHGEAVRIAPGMMATVEIKIGYRRIIEYFLAPLLRAANESLGER